MDLLDNVATELGFEFHLYVVRDHLFGARKQRTKTDFLKNKKQTSTNYKSSTSTSSINQQQNTKNEYDAYHRHVVDDADINDCKFIFVYLLHVMPLPFISRRCVDYEIIFESN